MHIVDRRLNPGGKSLVNRQRFLRRARAYVQQAVRETLKDRSIRDLDREGKISIRRDAIHEPTLHRAGQGGNRERVFPGNRDYLEGDRIKRPGAGSGSGTSSGDGEGEDDFQFVLTREEFLDLFLDDLELPDLAKRRLIGGDVEGIRRAGYSTAGNPSNLSVPRTMQKAMSRRIALKRPSSADLRKIEQEIADIEAREQPLPDDVDRLARLREEHAHVTRRRNLIAYIDPVDLRYRRFESVPRPVAQAVMFCLMDVSGSMNEHMKDLAKRFFALLHLFLTRCYEHVEIVFIHHTDKAAEVDEQTFFYSTVTGGTLVSSALEKLMEVVAERYPPDDWNIYVAQASDGDTLVTDNARVVNLMQNAILPISQYVAYLEVGREEVSDAEVVERPTGLWQAYATVIAAHGHFVMRKVGHRREIYPVFRELFQRQRAAERRRA
ncbi:YeaH/YhbH family protein [Sphingobium sp. H39-3-25]|uniref:YeaH/YhbH family protein n=1 Tax=Sphingobium arseniciresistens TaxID=3030834 RepID=UPI0023B9F28B|nr:YeaH/YhbH family protein [Sphingobium arseniciresistens]